MLSVHRRSTALILIMMSVPVMLAGCVLMLGVGMLLVIIPLFAAIAVVLKPR